jgi:hypothetical protein
MHFNAVFSVFVTKPSVFAVAAVLPPTTRATAHILGCPVLGQNRPGIQSCIETNKKDDDGRAIKNA